MISFYVALASHNNFFYFIDDTTASVDGKNPLKCETSFSAIHCKLLHFFLLIRYPQKVSTLESVKFGSFFSSPRRIFIQFSIASHFTAHSDISIDHTYGRDEIINFQLLFNNQEWKISRKVELLLLNPANNWTNCFNMWM